MISNFVEKYVHIQLVEPHCEKKLFSKFKNIRFARRRINIRVKYVFGPLTFSEFWN